MRFFCHVCFSKKRCFLLKTHCFFEKVLFFEKSINMSCFECMYFLQKFPISVLVEKKIFFGYTARHYTARKNRNAVQHRLKRTKLAAGFNSRPFTEQF